jgi:hypothetical protein
VECLTEFSGVVGVCERGCGLGRQGRALQHATCGWVNGTAPLPIQTMIRDLRSQHACILACMDNFVIRVLTSTRNVVLISAPFLL